MNEYNSKLYRMWANMKQRCYNPKSQRYNSYGNKGIKVYTLWKVYYHFKKWAEANGYEEGLSIDRINNHGNYRPDNVRFVTKEFNSSRPKSIGYMTDMDKKRKQDIKDRNNAMASMYNPRSKHYDII